MGLEHEIADWRYSNLLFIARMIDVHPKVVLDYPDIPLDLKQAVERHVLDIVIQYVSP